MKVERIEYYRKEFVRELLNDKADIAMDKYQVQESWAEYWNIESMDLKSVFNKSLDSELSGRLWGGSVDSAKSAMLQMIETDKDFVRSMFRNLFQEGKDLGLRLDRFYHHIDELYRLVLKSNPKAIEHHHQARATQVLYLACAFPESYCLFQYRPFEKMMEALESRNIPQEHEIERYFKSMRAIYKILTKDPTVLQALAMRCAMHEITFRPSLMIMNDYADFVNKSAK